MNCPTCGNKQLCGCKYCKPTRQPGEIVQVRFALNNDVIACGYCGHAMHIDEWEMLAILGAEQAEGQEGE